MAYIVKDAPIPEDYRQKGKTKYPFDKLEVGESFMIGNKEKIPAGETEKECSTLINMRVVCSRERRRTPDKQFYARIYPIDDRWIQIWRES